MTDERFAQPLLILDADSTIRHGYGELGRFVNTPDDVVLFPEVPGRCADWKSANQGRIIVVSNQAGIGYGHAEEEMIRAAFARTGELLDAAVLALPAPEAPVELPVVDQFVWCPHTPEDQCWCRKPQPGLVHRALRLIEARWPHERYPTDCALMVGDRPEDRQMAERLGIEFLEAAEWRDPRLMLAKARGYHWLGNAETIAAGGKRAECGGCLAIFDRPDPPVHTTRWADDAIEAHIFDAARMLGELTPREADASA